MPPINTIAVTGKVYTPAGVAATGGRILIELIPPGGHCDDNGVEMVVSPALTAVIAADGSVSFSLIPTDLIFPPAGGLSFYRATYEVGGQRWVHYWDGPLSTGDDPIEIGNITVTEVLGGLVVYPAPPSVSADPPLTLANWRRFWTIKPTGEPEQLRTILKDADGNLTYKTVAVGG